MNKKDSAPDSHTDNTTVKPRTKYESTAMPELQEDTTVLKKRQTTLVLDEEAPKAKSRGDLYKELTKNEKELTEEDYFEFTSPVVRGISLAIDAAFVFLLIQVMIMTSPFLLKTIHFFLDKYKLEMWIPDSVALQGLIGLDIFLGLFLFVVIPVAFFNATIGKKLTKIRVRGDDKYTLSISQAFQRELIFKPISIACLAGFVLPFFDKKKKSLHDKIAKTFVIKE